MLKHYRTIKQDGQHTIEIKKSRFICQLKRTETEEEGEAFIEAVKNDHKEATHNCSAYLIGDQDQYQRARDDGEPSGTAGVPMLDILKKRQLKNVTAVVTRYFGGTLLGSGGLVRAYSGAVNETINQLGVVERRLLQEVRVTTDYSSSGKIENELRQWEALILHDIEYGQQVSFVCYLEDDLIDQLKTQVLNYTAGQAQFQEGRQAYIEIDQDH